MDAALSSARVTPCVSPTSPSATPCGLGFLAVLAAARAAPGAPVPLAGQARRRPRRSPSEATLDNYLEGGGRRRSSGTTARGASARSTCRRRSSPQGGSRRRPTTSRRRAPTGRGGSSWSASPDRRRARCCYYDPTAGRWSTPGVVGGGAGRLGGDRAVGDAGAQGRRRSRRPRSTSTSGTRAYRILLYPITDETSQVVGLAGMILDEALLPRPRCCRRRSATRSPSTSPATRPTSRWSRCATRHGEVVFTSDRPASAPRERRRRDEALPFVFTDWTIGIASRHATPAEVARRNFARQHRPVGCCSPPSLLGGVVLALRTASRAMRLSRDEERLRLQRLARAAHAARLDPRLRRAAAPGPGREPEKVREYGEYIETESRRLTQLINNILDFSRIESGRKSYRFERADLREVVGRDAPDLRGAAAPERLRHPLRAAGGGRCRRCCIDAGAIAQSLVEPARQRRQVLERRQGDRGRRGAARAAG